jgi:hypothetical protein
MYVSYMSGIFDFTGTQVRVIARVRVRVIARVRVRVIAREREREKEREERDLTLTLTLTLTLIQMVLTMKLTSFAYNLYDGTADRKKVFPATPHTNKKDFKMFDDRRKYAIEKLPNPIEFFGYVYCFTCLLAGPG